MNIVYPLFILEKDDNSIYMVIRKYDLSYFELVDINNCIYSGWDSRGYPLRIVFEKHHRLPEVEIADNVPQFNIMEEAVVNYAKLILKDRFDSYYVNKDLIILMEKVQDVESERMLIIRLKRWTEKALNFIFNRK